MSTSDDETVGESIRVGDAVTAFDATPDGQILVTASRPIATPRGDSTGAATVSQANRASSKIIIWDAATSAARDTLENLPFAVRSILILPDGSEALIACSDVHDLGDEDAPADRILRLPLQGNPQGFQEAPPLLNLAGYDTLAAAAISPDGARLVTMNGSDAHLFDLEEIRVNSTAASIMAFRRQDALADAQFSPDGDRVVTASWDGTVRIWDPQTQKTLRTIRAHDGFINSVVFSPDGTLILTASNDKTARLWDGQTGELVGEAIAGHTATVNQAVFSPDGDVIATASADGTARLWDATSGQQIGAPIQHTSPVFCVAFSTDGARLITGDEDGVAYVWSIDGRARQAVLSGHTATITSVAFSGDGTRAFTASRDRTTKVWDVSQQGLEFSDTEEGQPAKATDLLTLRGHNRGVTSVAVSSDGLKILTGSRDGTAIVWQAEEWRSDAAPQEVKVLGNLAAQ
jgi:WD40 repeat protein